MAKRIEVSDLDIFYGGFKAVEGVNMTIEPVTITALIGPSGCGKSTFLRTLNRMHEVDARRPGARARCVMDGQDLYGDAVDPVAVRRQIGMVFQRPNPFPTMSIYDNVAAGVQAQRRADAQGRRSTSWSSARCAAPTCGKRSRTGSSGRAPACPAASSSGCASRGRSPSSRTSC